MGKCGNLLPNFRIGHRPGTARFLDLGVLSNAKVATLLEFGALLMQIKLSFV
jgi:hypothetical protein